MLQCPSNGQCYSQSQHCDGNMDCEDGHDEKVDCSRCQDLGMFQCPSDGKCISMSMHCDGKTDCEDAHDELFSCFDK